MAAMKAKWWKASSTRRNSKPKERPARRLIERAFLIPRSLTLPLALAFSPAAHVPPGPAVMAIGIQPKRPPPLFDLGRCQALGQPQHRRVRRGGLGAHSSERMTAVFLIDQVIEGRGAQIAAILALPGNALEQTSFPGAQVSHAAACL